MSKQRFENKTFYDPGRFRFTICFYQEAAVDDGSGGNIPSLTYLLTTNAIQESLVKRLGFSGNMSIDAGAGILNDGWYFIIRNRSNFYPEKDMIVVVNNQGYVISAVIPLDMPVNYIKCLCIRRDMQLTT